MGEKNGRVPRFVITLALGTFVVVLDTTFMNVSITSVLAMVAPGAFLTGALGLGLAYAPYAFLSYLSPLVTMALAFIYLSKKTLSDDQDAQSAYGLVPDDEDLPAPQVSA